ncbi:DUF808 domain-containing protein [Sphingobacterium sp. IITKGP-BTPF85]|uniref:DUF808 domain-containing protein n=1 Tax=Sphingobacterium sp. IITKGP-BTPF85 TaxID=1338009 RepID=UPI000418F071|nr:DUF808 domain-containing protein [Sphingobacterium sp. IITKGP-BTPF85]KKX47979.1 hypothetical protein L950_0223615 [Sphingobacterium sp. IITKGP-BTPF85]
MESEENNSEAEKIKVKSAITTDFILSVEIVIIALGTVLNESLTIQILTVAVVALFATVGVYGIVALIVRMDDAGYKLIKRSNDEGAVSKLGHLLVNSLPVVIKVLAVVGTIALILVSGGIFEHNIDYLHHFLPQVPSLLKQIAYGAVAGLTAVLLMTGGKKIFAKSK